HLLTLTLHCHLYILLFLVLSSSNLYFSSFLYLFFFYSSGPPRYLHSFPTRRSSDLRHIVTDTCGLLVGAEVHPADIQDRDGADRSEEHTSELQSPDHLVCRLLLEKKKKKNKKKTKIIEQYSIHKRL